MDGADLSAEVARLRELLMQAETRRALAEEVIERVPVAIEVFDRHGTAVSMNAAMQAFLGVPDRNAAIGIFNVFQDPVTAGDIRASFERAYRGEIVHTPAYSVDLSPSVPQWHTSSRVAWFEMTLFPLRAEDGSIEYVVSMSWDVTERKRVENALVETQKQESLAMLAGRIAHDLNNALAGILGNATLALDNVDDSGLTAECLESIVRGSELAANLSRQLLGYAGKGRFVQEALSLSNLVGEMGQLLGASLPKKVTVRYKLAAELPAVLGDATQIRQVVMNLITNAADAIGGASGTISISTGERAVGQGTAWDGMLQGELNAGRYVTLEVTDTGCGMTAETAQRMFDPFFTTKPKGYGLGLAATLGIVRGHGGALLVRSSLGAGTTMTLFLPALEQHVEAPARRSSPTPQPGSGRILLVDDEPLVRSFLQRLLRRSGYDVVEAADGARGVEVLREQGGTIDLVLLDLNMPALGGAEVLYQMREREPGIAVLMMSGYDASTAGALAKHTNIRFLSKPFDSAALLREVVALLARR